MNRSATVALSFVALVLTACAAPPKSRPPEFLTRDGATGFPFSPAVRVGNTLYLSGQLGTDPATKALVAGGLAPEARQTIENIRAVLESNGSSLSQVFKCTAFLADMREWPAFNDVYKEYFKPPYPARSAVGVTGLALGARLELECIAFVP